MMRKNAALDEYVNGNFEEFVPPSESGEHKFDIHAPSHRVDCPVTDPATADNWSVTRDDSKNYAHVWVIQGDDIENYDVVDVAKEFAELCKTWRRETAGLSSATKLILHPAYQKIIGLGMSVVPFILRDISNGRGHWDWALRAITRIDPIPPDAGCKSSEVAQSWLNWGHENGMI